MSWRNFDVEVKTLRGEVVKNPDGSPVLLGGVLADILASGGNNAGSLSFKEKEELVALARKLLKGGVQDYHHKELVLIEDVAGPAIGVMLADILRAALETDTQPQQAA